MARMGGDTCATAGAVGLRWRGPFPRGWLELPATLAAAGLPDRVASLAGLSDPALACCCDNPEFLAVAGAYCLSAALGLASEDPVLCPWAGRIFAERCRRWQDLAGARVLALTAVERLRNCYDHHTAILPHSALAARLRMETLRMAEELRRRQQQHGEANTTAHRASVTHRRNASETAAPASRTG